MKKKTNSKLDLTDEIVHDGIYYNVCMCYFCVMQLNTQEWCAFAKARACKGFLFSNCQQMEAGSMFEYRQQCLYNPESWAVTVTSQLVGVRHVIRAMDCIFSLIMLLREFPIAQSITCKFRQTNVQLTTYVNLAIIITKHAALCLCNTVQHQQNKAKCKQLSVIVACTDYLLSKNAWALTSGFILDKTSLDRVNCGTFCIWYDQVRYFIINKDLLFVCIWY